MRLLLSVMAATALISGTFASISQNTKSFDYTKYLKSAGWDNSKQDYSFEKYCSDLKQNDVEMSLPNGFKPFDTTPQSIRNYFKTSSYVEQSFDSYPIGLISNDNEAVMLFPSITLNWNAMQNYGFVIEQDLRTQHLDHNLDVTPYVKVIEEPDMSKYSNAEKVALYELDLSYLPFMEKYTKCIGVYIKKRKHPAQLVKIMLTDDSYKNKDKYISMVFDNIHYGNDNAYAQMEGDYTWDKCWREEDPNFPWVRNSISEEDQRYYRQRWKKGIAEMRQCWKEGKEFKWSPIEHDYLKCK